MMNRSMRCEKRNCCLVILCGIPGSGKSTLSFKLKEWLDELGNILPVIISYDKLMPAHVESSIITNQKDEKSLWKKYRDDIVSCVDSFLVQNFMETPNTSKTVNIIDKGIDPMVLNFFTDLSEKITTVNVQNTSTEKINTEFLGNIDEEIGRNEENRDEVNPANKEKEDDINYNNQTLVIIIDDNMYYRSMRYSYYQISKYYSLGFCEVYISCDISNAFERNSLRQDDYVDPDIIQKMADKFEIPNKLQYSWEKFSINCESDALDSSRSDILSLIDTAIKNPVQPVEEIDPELLAQSQRISSTNIIHQTDLILRQLISHCMVSTKDSKKPKSELKSLGKKFSEIKSQILQEFREGKVKLNFPEDNINNSSHDIMSPLYIMVKKKFDELNT